MATFLNSPWPYLATAAFVAWMGLYAWKQPRRMGPAYFRWMVGLWFVWALAAALQTIFRPLQLRYGLWALQSVIALLIAPLELLFSLQYTGNEKWLARRSLLLLFLPALLLTVIAVALPGTMASIEYSSGIPVIMARDLVKWGFYSYVLILVLVSLGVLFACLLRAPAFWAPILLIIFGSTIPVVGFATVDPQWVTISSIHIAILLSNFSALAYSVAQYNFGLLRVTPVARDTVIQRMPYGLIVLDADNRLVDFNPATQSLPGLPGPGKLVLRQPAARALGEWWGRLSALLGSQFVSQEVSVQTSTGQRHFHVDSLPLLQASGWRMGQVFVLQDVTQARQAQQQQAQAQWAQATLQEREELADELHDGLSQNLAFINLQAQAAQVYIETGQNEAAQNSLVRLSEVVIEILEDTRTLIGDLLSVTRPAENFCVTLRQILAGFEQQTGIPVHLEMDGEAAAPEESLCDPARLPPAVAVQLVRITQEALANVRKHARNASQVSVQLSANGDQLFLAITDDGAGFDPAEPRSAGKHFGLQVMRQRAGRIGGRVTVVSAAGKGTCIEVRVPLAAPLPAQSAGSGTESNG